MTNSEERAGAAVAEPRAATMRAAVFTGPGTVELQEVAVPQPAPGEVRIRLAGSGVCASNLANWQGMPWSQFPSEPGGMGHEGWGMIDAVGDGVRNLNVGDRVAAVSYHAYAAYDLASSSAVVKLPATLDGRDFPGEAFGCAMNIFRRAQISSTSTVAIVGIGFLGAVVTRLAAHAGARVLAISRRPFSLSLARRFGAAETILLDDHYRILHTVKQLTSGRFCDVVVEAVGKQWPLDLAAELAAERGRLVIAGYHQDGPRQVNMQLWNWRGLDVINAHERATSAYVTGIHAAVDAVASGILDPAPLLTRFPLSRLSDALDATRDRPDGFVKAVVIND